MNKKFCQVLDSKLSINSVCNAILLLLSLLVGLGGIAILVLDISYRKKRDIAAVFTKTCELTVQLESFDLFTDLALQVPGFWLQ